MLHMEQPTKKASFQLEIQKKGQLLAPRPPLPRFSFSLLGLPDNPSPVPPVAAPQYYDEIYCDRSQTSDFSTDGSILLRFLLGTYYGLQLPSLLYGRQVPYENFCSPQSDESITLNIQFSLLSYLSSTLAGGPIADVR
jgi:hypothetical protein